MSVNNIRTVRRALAHEEASLRGLRDQTGSASHIYHRGIYVTCHSTAPPSATEYQRWFELHRSPDPRGRSRIKTLDGAKLRRMVVMRRQGSSLVECGLAAGITGKAASEWLSRLPEGLAA